MKKNKQNSNGEEPNAKRSKLNEKSKNDDLNDDNEDAGDDVTSTLALQNDLKSKISKNPFNRTKQPKRLIVVLEHASLETV